MFKYLSAIFCCVPLNQLLTTECIPPSAISSKPSPTEPAISVTTLLLSIAFNRLYLFSDNPTNVLVITFFCDFFDKSLNAFPVNILSTLDSLLKADIISPLVLNETLPYILLAIVPPYFLSIKLLIILSDKYVAIPKGTDHLAEVASSIPIFLILCLNSDAAEEAINTNVPLAPILVPPVAAVKAIIELICPTPLAILYIADDQLSNTDSCSSIF